MAPRETKLPPAIERSRAGLAAIRRSSKEQQYSAFLLQAASKIGLQDRGRAHRLPGNGSDVSWRYGKDAACASADPALWSTLGMGLLAANPKARKKAIDTAAQAQAIKISANICFIVLLLYYYRNATQCAAVPQWGENPTSMETATPCGLARKRSVKE